MKVIVDIELNKEVYDHSFVEKLLVNITELNGVEHATITSVKD